MLSPRCHLLAQIPLSWGKYTLQHVLKEKLSSVSDVNSIPLTTGETHTPMSPTCCEGTLYTSKTGDTLLYLRVAYFISLTYRTALPWTKEIDKKHHFLLPFALPTLNMLLDLPWQMAKTQNPNKKIK